jgi:C4-dicarboxylate-specific signal transduction histidine kinase
MVIRIVTWLGFALLLDRLKTALAHADERFVTVLARLDAAVYVADSESGALLYMNHHCEEAFGRGLTNVREIERRWHAADRPPPTGAGGPQQELQDSISGHWYLLAARAINWIDGRPVGLYIATDVTDRKRTEELARRQEERLEMTSRLTTLGEMASTLAHEINQPLTAIASYCMGCVRRLRSGDGAGPATAERGPPAAAVPGATSRVHAHCFASALIQRRGAPRLIAGPSVRSRLAHDERSS